ncbi:MAG: 2-amino-4-hydroxy-6-hydroxymethyldihydropteridine diphosphokinase [Woeseiaceae bacterium]|nr:2-amino-4-hydroxy-6-hydroxymethyldihydropteridine diphosphokinase [Woeseiaceae bacterium]
MAVAYLGIGSNVEPGKYLTLAIDELRSRFQQLTVSPVYQSKALGFVGEDFLNVVARIQTDLSPRQLIDELDSIQRLAGRERSAKKFVSRTLDIDLLLYDDLVVTEPGMQLPRPDTLEFSFVLKPLADIAPDLEHPLTGKRILDHWREFDAQNHPLKKVELSL